METTISTLRNTINDLQAKIKNFQLLFINLKKSTNYFKNESRRIIENLVKMLAIYDNFSMLQIIERLSKIVSYEGVTGFFGRYNASDNRNFC